MTKEGTKTLRELTYCSSPMSIREKGVRLRVGMTVEVNPKELPAMEVGGIVVAMRVVLRFN